MKFLTPQFWQDRGLKALLLWPLSQLYGMVYRFKNFLSIIKPKKVSCPVICVGNLTVGGTGKTPVVLALAKYFKAPALLSRGYGGTEQGPLLVDPQVHNARQIGDEAIILAQHHPTWVGQNRYYSAVKAMAAGAKSLILDDGLQHLSLYQDVRIAVIDGYYGFGNEWLLPAGPLRVDIKQGLKNIDAVVIIGTDQHSIKKRYCDVYNIPVIMADVKAIFDDLEIIKQQSLIAFAGIGRPQKFFDLLKHYDCQIIEHLSFPDHYDYQDHDLESLQQRAQDQKAILVTTEKDYVRLPVKLRDHVKMVHVELQFENSMLLEKIIEEKLGYVH